MSDVGPSVTLFDFLNFPLIFSPIFPLFYPPIFPSILFTDFLTDFFIDMFSRFQIISRNEPYFS